MAERGSPPVSSQRGRLLPCKVLMLDNSTIVFPVAVKSFGQVLFDAVVEKLRILEADYFDLQFQDSESIPCWLDRDKPIAKQVSLQDLRFRFLVKFYTPDPGLLEDELTRYLFALQVKRDLQTGALFCQEHTAVLLASFIVQAEWGDYSDELVDQDYLSQKQLLPNHTKEIQMKIMEHHKEHFNQSAEEADYNLLDTARKVEMYGIHLHPAKDHEGINLFLAVAHMGVIVFQNCTKINAFSWAKIRKLCFRRKKFIIKLHTDGGAYNKDTVEFYFVSRNWSKTFWKKCIEHHAFFRCHCIRHVPRSRSRVVSRGSSFRYRGKTQKELIDYVRENYVSPTPFERSTSMRTMSVMSSRAGTPKAGTLNSHDLNFSAQMGHSGGSRILNHSQPSGCDRRPAVGNPQSRVSESPLSQNKTYHTFQGQAAQMAHFDGLVGNHAGHRTNTLGNGNRGNPGAVYPTSDLLDPSKFMLSKETLSSSAIFASSRSTSRETAPDCYRFQQRSVDSDEPYASTHPTSRPHNATVGMVRDGWPPPHPGMFRQDTIPAYGEDDLPPPPPPVFEEEARRHHGRLTRGQRDETTTGKSSASAASVTLTSNASTMSSQTEESEEEDRKKQKFFADRTYYIFKELLMTERTYKKDLELMTVCLRDAVSCVDVIHDYLMELMFGSLAPIYDCHCSLLRELEQRMALWEGRSARSGGRSTNGVGDLLLKYMSVLQWYQTYFANQEELLIQLDLTMKNHREFDQLIVGFESRRICYLPLTSFLMKPIQKLMHYRLVLERLLMNYTADHFDVKDCRECLALVGEVVDSFSDRLKHLENRQKLTELQRDICGVDNLLHPGRLFMREGCLQKLSQKGYQQRMFFLFSDMLVYTSRVTTPALQFKVHGQMSLKGMTVEETDSKMASAEFSFTIYAGNRCLMVAASSEEEKDRWMEDIQRAIAEAATRGDESVRSIYSSLKSNSSSETLEDAQDEMRSASSPDNRHVQQRANTTIHVCWHRSVSIGMRDHMVAIRNQLSGYLLRKFKNSNGWQKLWVVFTNFCLFFYKNFQDDFPLASLPLLGYSVGAPSDGDAIHKDFVFKLQFKNHVYFFRAESEYTFERWIEVIGSVTRVARASSRLDGSASPLPPKDFTSVEKHSS